MLFTNRMRDASPLTLCRISCLGPALKMPMACTLVQQLALIHTCSPPCSFLWIASYDVAKSNRSNCFVLGNQMYCWPTP